MYRHQEQQQQQPHHDTGTFQLGGNERSRRPYSDTQPSLSDDYQFQQQHGSHPSTAPSLASLSADSLPLPPLGFDDDFEFLTGPGSGYSTDFTDFTASSLSSLSVQTSHHASALSHSHSFDSSHRNNGVPRSTQSQPQPRQSHYLPPSSHAPLNGRGSNGTGACQPSRQMRSRVEAPNSAHPSSLPLSNGTHLSHSRSMPTSLNQTHPYSHPVPYPGPRPSTAQSQAQRPQTNINAPLSLPLHGIASNHHHSYQPQHPLPVVDPSSDYLQSHYSQPSRSQLQSSARYPPPSNQTNNPRALSTGVNPRQYQQMSSASAIRRAPNPSASRLVSHPYHLASATHAASKHRSGAQPGSFERSGPVAPVPPSALWSPMTSMLLGDGNNATFDSAAPSSFDLYPPVLSSHSQQHPASQRLLPAASSAALRNNFRSSSQPQHQPQPFPSQLARHPSSLSGQPHSAAFPDFDFTSDPSPIHIERNGRSYGLDQQQPLITNHRSQSAQQPQQLSSSSPPASTPSLTACELGNEYVVLDYLGSGSYGSVHLCERVRDKRTVAIKKIINVFDNITNAKRLLREIKILRMLTRHDNVIGFYHLLPVSSLSTFNDICMVFEFVDTDLQKLLHSQQHFTNLHIQYFMYQLITGVAYIHSASIIHRDIKPANVLVNADCSLKVCDFGLARFAETNASNDREISNAVKHQSQEQAQQPAPRSKRVSSISSLSSSLIHLPSPPSRARRELTRHVVTRWYRAPELILLSDHYSTAIDLWSVGCILAELLSMQSDTDNTPPENRSALFPGRSCFPLSADHPMAYADQLDQLNVIFDVIGTPSPEDLAMIENETAKNYLNGLQNKHPVRFQSRYPRADHRAIDLLEKLLCFNPSKRYTAEQCLYHPFFDEVRDENCHVSWKDNQQSDYIYHSKGRINPKVEFAFEDQSINENQIREMLVQELLIDQPHLRPVPPQSLSQYQSSSPYPNSHHSSHPSVAYSASSQSHSSSHASGAHSNQYNSNGSLSFHPSSQSHQRPLPIHSAPQPPSQMHHQYVLPSHPSRTNRPQYQ